jgi:DnaJ-class molecular chaperone
MSFVDICPHCDGTGERDFLSGAKCYECNGTGIREETDPDDEEFEPYDDEEQ